jgi:hypothetical protein
MRFWGKILFRAGVALLWLVVAALCLEGYERGRRVWGERYYATYFAEQTARVYRMTPALEEQRARHQAVAAAVPEAAPAPADAAPTDCAPDSPERKAAREALAAKGPDYREVVDTLEGVMTARFSADGGLIEMRGDPLFKKAAQAALDLGGPAKLFSGLPALFDGQAIERELPPVERVLQRLTPVQMSARSRRIYDGTGFRSVVEVTLRQLQPLLLEPNEPLDEKYSSLIPNVKYKRNWRPQGEMATYNNYGFRDDDVIVPKPAGVYRIVCVGGSTTEEGNLNDFSYPNIMERHLRESLGPHIEVINCGISGIRSYWEWRRMEDYLALEPDLIIYYNAINDLANEHLIIWRKSIRGWREKLLYSAALTRRFNHLLLPPDAEVEQFIWEHTILNLRAMAWRARECGVPMAFCSFATPAEDLLNFRDRLYLDINTREVWGGGHLTYPTLQKALDVHNQLLRRMCDVDGLHYIPAAEELHGGMEHFLDTCHMTPPGMEVKTAIIARHVAAIIEDSQPQP